MLGKSGVWEILRVDVPDAARAGVVVVDGDALERLAAPLENPERVVLVDRGDGVDLDRAFEMGIKSVVSSRDPLDTVLLAIMAAGLRASRSMAGVSRRVPLVGKD
jgi:DNA-binding NarL/FixJ family response regulator